MRKVVVTGGSGRLGQFVIRELLAHRYQVLSWTGLRLERSCARVGSRTCVTQAIYSKL